MIVSDCFSNTLNGKVRILQFGNTNKGVGISKDEGIDGIGKGEGNSDG
jgi:hypothetical protein